MSNDEKISDRIWISDFTDSALQGQINQLLDLEADPLVDIIPIFISSYGGEVASLMALRDVMKASKKQVVTVALGKAMSCGAFLLAAGTKGLRFAAPSAAIMIHEVSGAAIGKTTDLKDSADDIKRLNEQVMSQLAKDCGITKKKLMSILHKRANTDWTLTAEEAKALGLVDHVGVPTFTKEVVWRITV